MKKDITTFVPKIKYLPEAFAVAMIFSFIVGIVYNPNLKTEQSSLNPLVKVIRDTIFLTREVEEDKPKKVEDIVVNDNGRNFAYQYRNHDEQELRNELNKQGFRNLEKLNLYQLRRLVILENYNDMLMQVHYVTDFPVTLLYSTFIFEATSNGVETLLWRKYANPGGVKAIKGHGKVSLKTTEYINGKKKRLNQYFFKGEDSEEGIKVWSNIFNNPRYKKCKKANYRQSTDKLYNSFCKCMYKAGYHTDPNYAARAVLMKEYWDFTGKHLPKNEF